ncbi:MAG: 50S ribosomal protein L11 methyltransferase [Hyphomonadaceae bacterium]|nr:50S ribosomal protein L11 methyltransferase [Hyphomonadaceae bacterium]
MPLYKLRIEAADLATGRPIADLLEAASTPPALAVALFELAPPTYVVEAYYDQSPSLDAIARLLDGLGAGLGGPVLEAVPDTNWVALSQAALPPISAGRFIVHGSHDRACFAMHRRAIEIEAGEAFGTGHNATTALCLEALSELVRTRRFAHVLDLGCGTAILAIAAARALPDARVLASDNDAIATAIGRDNARLNRVAQRVEIVTATGFAHARLRRAQPFDLVLANILPGPLIALAQQMRRALARSGVAVLSGLLDHQVREVVQTYRACGFRLLRCTRSGGWAALTLLNTRA